MENEENRGLINKQDSEDQWETIVSEGLISLVLELLIILSLSHTLGYLEFYWRSLRGCGILVFLEKEGKQRAWKHKRASKSSATLNFL